MIFFLHDAVKSSVKYLLRLRILKTLTAKNYKILAVFYAAKCSPTIICTIWASHKIKNPKKMSSFLIFGRNLNKNCIFGNKFNKSLISKSYLKPSCCSKLNYHQFIRVSSSLKVQLVLSQSFSRFCRIDMQ
jgi:hypothetical protein